MVFHVQVKPFRGTQSGTGSQQITEKKCITGNNQYHGKIVSWCAPVSMNPNGVEYDLICGCYHDMDPICFMGDGWMKMLRGNVIMRDRRPRKRKKTDRSRERD